MKKQITKKLIAFTIAAMMFSVNAYSQIVYTNVNPDTTVINNNAVYNLDLNNDGIIDFRFRKESYYMCPYTIGFFGTTYTDIEIDALNGNEVSNDSNNYPKKINYNNVIKSASTNWMSSASQLLAKKSNKVSKGRFQCYTLYPTTYNGNWNAANDKYVGLRLIIGGNKYYGWVRLNVSNGGTSVTIKDYAYDSTPNHSIHAGATSGLRVSANETPVRMLKGNFKYMFNKRNSLSISDIPFVQNQKDPQERIVPPSMCSQKTYGGSDDEYFGYVLKLRDGNYMLYGNSDSNDGDLTGNHGEDDGYLIKIDAAGNILWSKTYGGSAEDGFNQLIEKPNGDIIAVGFTESNDGDVSGNHGGFDGWLIKVDKDGNFKSQHCYGGSADDDFQGIIKGTNGSYIIAGIVGSDDGDVTGAGNHGGDADGWVLKINSNGNLVWQKCIGGSDFEQFQSIISINNKYYVSGITYSFDGDATQNHSTPGHFDHFLAKLKSNGDIQWVACHGGSNDDFCIIQSLIPTPDGNLINVGTTLSTDGDVQGHVNYEADAWAPKISAATGALISQHCYGSVTRMQGFYSGMPTNDGGFLMVGAEASNFNIDSTFNAMVIKTDANGNEVWKKVFGGSDQDIVEGIVRMDNGDYLMACYSRSSDGDVTNKHGNGDIWMVELGNCCNNHDRETQFDATSGSFRTSLNCFPNPFSNSTNISYSLLQSEKVTVRIFDMTGRLVKALVNGEVLEGTQQINWNATDENGTAVDAGIYFLMLETGNYSETKRLSVVR